MQINDYRHRTVRSRLRRRSQGFTLLELMVVIGIIGIIAAVGFGKSMPCRGAIKQIAITLSNDIVAARNSARANNVTINFWFGQKAAEDAGYGQWVATIKYKDPSAINNSFYLRHLDINSNLKIDPGEEVFMKHMDCSGDNSSIIEFAPVPDAGAVVDASGSHTPDAVDGVSLEMTSPSAHKNLLSVTPSGIANTLTAGTDTIYINVRPTGPVSAESRFGRAMVVRLNGKTLVYGSDMAAYKTYAWTLLR